ncbi:DUF4762 family protein [Providencia huaxiensis]|uniref:DUF4762 domain-containing protein n=1 Tax=Providencia huaxiensis TaxID=2027290 RepID=A0A345M0H5_9GAMM|nr:MULTISPECIES: DUF4762 family protein [Providencia]AXH63865.1 DUF4762 domain-containing protein [Providencia huaxiensis]MBN6362553.1 DUF4762 domain-containing protein [Providencia huaxiensis]MBQ0268152.1 DUF4762 domain-containing protein [Providencia huaxiensis]MBQ0532821.1 DUF4762 domain-containing protein [Providencia huaxiensis]MBQ0587287.1 DUF4762 domain-containing protein [Providencia huaxiensis]
MKKLNAIEAAAVIGGTEQVCTDTYESITIGGVKSCQLVTTCTDKHGNKTYSAKAVDAPNCDVTAP